MLMLMAVAGHADADGRALHGRHRRPNGVVTFPDEEARLQHDVCGTVWHVTQVSNDTAEQE